MGISEIYGVDEPTTPWTASATPDIPAKSVPADSGIEEQPPAQEHSDIDANPRQTTVEPQVVPPSHAAVAEIERFLAAGQHPVDTAAPFLVGTDHTVDPDSAAGRAAPRRRSRFRSLRAGLLGSVETTRDGDPAGADEDDEPGAGDADQGDSGAGRRPRKPQPDGEDTTGGDQPDARDGRSWPLQTRHMFVGAVFTVVVLLAAVMIGRSAQPDSTAPPAAATPPPAAAAAQSARDAPIQPVEVTAVCGAGSSDPKAAFGSDKSVAWKCLAPFHGVGQVLMR